MQPSTKPSRWVPVLGAGALAIAAGVVHAAGELRVLNWQGYGTDEEWAVQIFEERTGFKVVHDNFNSEQEMLTKLRTSPGAYDVVLINSAFTCSAAGKGSFSRLTRAESTTSATCPRTCATRRC